MQDIFRIVAGQLKSTVRLRYKRLKQNQHVCSVHIPPRGNVKSQTKSGLCGVRNADMGSAEMQAQHAEYYMQQHHQLQGAAHDLAAQQGYSLDPQQQADLEHQHLLLQQQLEQQQQHMEGAPLDAQQQQDEQQQQQQQYDPHDPTQQQEQQQEQEQQPPAQELLDAQEVLHEQHGQEELQHAPTEEQQQPQEHPHHHSPHPDQLDLPQG